MVMEAKRKAHEIADRIIPGETADMDGVKVPVPRYLRPGHHSPDPYEGMTRQQAVDVVAGTSWAQDWSRGMLRAFYPDFATLPEASRQALIREWSQKLAAKVVK